MSWIIIYLADIFYILALGLMGYEYYRMMSRRIERRFQENQKFMNIRYRLVVKWNKKYCEEKYKGHKKIR